MNFYEFGVTTTIDWQNVETIYVKAESSHDAIKYLLKLTDEDNEDKPFADFKFRTAIPECCMLNNVEILDSTQKPFFAIEIAKDEQEFAPWLEWYSVRMNGKIIGNIARNTNVEETYYFDALTDVHYGRWTSDRHYSGKHADLEAAKTAAFRYAEYLNEQ